MKSCHQFEINKSNPLLLTNKNLSVNLIHDLLQKPQNLGDDDELISVVH